ncbi:MAG: hypothetical protein FJY97_04135 [candidate division Zixibacteria bacterium]|nr:hypothetical protein [candidate division Zixibacteria bacterium]
MAIEHSETDSPRPAVSLRSVGVGLGLSAIVSYWGQFSADQLGYDPTYAQLPACLILPFLVLVLGPNFLLRRAGKSWVLTRSELIVVFAMGWAASMVPDRAMTRYLIAVITTPYYFANPENQWQEKFFDHLPGWLVLNDENGAATGFFEGIPPDVPIPWHDWLPPLFWWGTAIAALMWVGACIIVMLRKQWVEHDRLRFPLGEVAVHLMGQPDPDRPEEPPIFKTKMFRIGLIAGSAVMLWNVVSYWGHWPRFPIMGPDVTNITLERSFAAIPIRLNVLILCISFFANAEILFSVWFFILLGIIQQGLLTRIGVVSTASTIVPGGLVSIQSIGGMILFVLIGLWMSRGHLGAVWEKAWGHTSDLRDKDELFSYRTAVAGFAGGMLYLVFWLNQAGLSLSVTVLFLFFLFIFYLAIARICAEAGMVMIDLPINAHQFTVGMVGSSNLTTPDMTALGLTNAFARNWRTFTMIGISNIAWLRDRITMRSGAFFAACALAFGVSAVTSIGYIITAGYAYGAHNLRTGPGPLGDGFYNLIISWINNATQVTSLELSFLASGGVLMILLSLCRYLFYWWPLHPIGLVVVASGPAVGAVFPIFLAWLIQTLLIRTGGVRQYRRIQPLFIGILVAYVLGQGLSFFVDLYWFPDAPHAFDAF